jgi:hypothetical protein
MHSAPWTLTLLIALIGNDEVCTWYHGHHLLKYTNLVFVKRCNFGVVLDIDYFI